MYNPDHADPILPMPGHEMIMGEDVIAEGLCPRCDGHTRISRHYASCRRCSYQRTTTDTGRVYEYPATNGRVDITSNQPDTPRRGQPPLHPEYGRHKSNGVSLPSGFWRVAGTIDPNVSHYITALVEADLQKRGKLDEAREPDRLTEAEVDDAIAGPDELRALMTRETLRDMMRGGK